MSATVRPSPLALVVALFFIGNTGPVVCAAYSAPMSGAFGVLYAVGIAWGLSWWVLLDCRERGLPTSIDHGWFVFYTWPIAFPYHVFRTRGVRGFRILIALTGAFVVAYLFAMVVYVVLAPS